MVPVPVFEGVFEFVEGRIFRVEQRPIAGEELVVDYFRQRHLPYLLRRGSPNLVARPPARSVPPVGCGGRRLGFENSRSLSAWREVRDTADLGGQRISELGAICQKDRRRIAADAEFAVQQRLACNQSP